MNDFEQHEIVKVKATEIVEAKSILPIMYSIRHEWQSRNLIKRVERLLPVDPSSACQRIFNASIHDLKEKILVAGIDIASQAAKQNNMPEIKKPEYIEELDVTRTINLSYYMGLLTRAEWRRLCRCYDIRKDLEHEDDQYEATPEDCIYIFKTCIDVVLSKDPIQIIKLEEIKDIVEQDCVIVLTEDVLSDYEHAPIPRKQDIYSFLIAKALDKEKTPDIVRQNSYNAIGSLLPITQKEVIIEASKTFFKKREPLKDLKARVAYKSGMFAYLKQSIVKDYFNEYFKRLDEAGYSFKSHDKHNNLLRGLLEIGGLRFCPADMIKCFMKWLVLCYIGERSFGQWAGYRKVFYSNAGAPLSLEIIKTCPRNMVELIEQLRKDKDIKIECDNSDAVARRFEEIVDAISM